MQDHSVGEMGTYVRRWERHLRAQNKSPKTVKSCLEAARQFAAYLVEEADHDGDPTTVTHADVEEFIAHLNATRSPSTAGLDQRDLGRDLPSDHDDDQPATIPPESQQPTARHTWHRRGPASSWWRRCREARV